MSTATSTVAGVPPAFPVISQGSSRPAQEAAPASAKYPRLTPTIEESMFALGEDPAELVRHGYRRLPTAALAADLKAIQGYDLEGPVPESHIKSLKRIADALNPQVRALLTESLGRTLIRADCPHTLGSFLFRLTDSIGKAVLHDSCDIGLAQGLEVAAERLRKEADDCVRTTIVNQEPSQSMLYLRQMLLMIADKFTAFPVSEAGYERFRAPTPLEDSIGPS